MNEVHLAPDFKMRSLFMKETDPLRRQKIGLALLLRNTMTEVLFVMENSPGPFLMERASVRYEKLLNKQRSSQWN